MHTYIKNTEYAVKNLIQLLYVENQRLEKKKKSLDMLEEAARDIFEGMKKTGFSAEGIIDLDGFERACDKQRSEITEIQLLLSIIEFSQATIAGALLQIAKQGISLVHNGLTICPDGRLIGSEPLKNIIWQGRNQSMHFEEGNYNISVQDCFHNLETICDAKFQLSNKNLAFEMVTLLGWKSYEDYKNDMKLLQK